LYQLVSGKLPFATTDVMELIHSHIAIEPPMLPSHIPHMIEAIIFKLLKKDASERYRSCQGLLHDLQRCHQTMTNVGTTDGRYQIEKFALGENDFIERFNLPKRLYGRDTEIEQLLFTFDKVAMTGETAMLLVSGYSGIGKSSLVREVQRSVQVHFLQSINIIVTTWIFC
jgi:serine/threonine protein kinase